MLSGKALPPPQIDDQDDIRSDLEAAPDLEQYAKDQIRDYISRRFKGHKLTELVAALLTVQGYQVRVSPEGPDGGIDIIAGRGPLGFERPRLAVQVKSGDSPVDVKVLRELQGVMKNFGADQGLFVSWGGYRGSVTKEAARLFFEIRLWDSGDLVQTLQAHYDQLPDTMQAELPLKRVWTLVQSDEGAE
jgi:restriction system protein